MRVSKLAAALAVFGSVVVLNGCATSAPAQSDKILDAPYATDSDNQKSDDLALKHKLQDMLDTQLKGNDLRIMVSFSNVLVVGQTVNEDVKNQAVTLIKSIPSVKKVFNYITINSMPSLNSSSAISKQATDRLGLQKNVYPANLSVMTVDGVVYIMGSNVGDIRALKVAIQGVYSIEGVSKVVDLIQKGDQDY